MVAALKRAVRLRRTMRERDTRIEASGSAKARPLPGGEVILHTERGLTARELIRMAQAARRARQD
ncbi:hypothetical protein MHIMP23_11165 [Methylobacterium hispanicum]|uniref:Uncharacterized protein n=2 Tax=Methylobacteriaceae TaxID=119045 RepID=A0AAV4ZFD1_9HYPH|nr:hypothetical protein BHAOGJBA_0507 [Methylobacterium hispanicum]